MEAAENITQAIKKILKSVGYLCTMNDTHSKSYKWMGNEGKKTMMATTNVMKQNVHHIMRNLHIITEDAQYIDRWRSLVSVNRN